MMSGGSKMKEANDEEQPASSKMVDNNGKAESSMTNALYEKFGLLLNSKSQQQQQQQQHQSIFHRKEAAIPDFYRQHLFSQLNIRLNASSDLTSARSVNNTFESRRIYSDFSKNNQTAPLDLSGVRSVLKEYMKPSGYKSPQIVNQQTRKKTDDDESSSSSCESLNDEPLQTKPIRMETDRKGALLRRRKKQPTPVNKSLSNVRVIKSSNYNQHKGSIYNYRTSVRNNAFCFKITKSEDLEAKEEDDEEKNNKRPEVVQHVFYSDMSYLNKEKHQRRVQEARDKVLSGQVEKSKLNKMTVLHPFEDTKILINTDKVPSEIMNKILGTTSDSTTIRPMYYIPPVRPFGYYTKKTT